MTPIGSCGRRPPGRIATIAASAKAQVDGGLERAADVSPEKRIASGEFLNDALRHGEVPFKKAYLRMFVDRIDISRTGAKSGSARARSVGRSTR
jgi:hypothetical protein